MKNNMIHPFWFLHFVSEGCRNTSYRDSLKTLSSKDRDKVIPPQVNVYTKDSEHSPQVVSLTPFPESQSLWLHLELKIIKNISIFCKEP